MTDLIVFDWEKEEKPVKREMTEAQKEYRRRMDEFMKKQHGQA